MTICRIARSRREGRATPVRLRHPLSERRASSSTRPRSQSRASASISDGSLGVRIRGGLGRVRLAVPVDIGFGNVITLGCREEDYPTLLDLPAPRLWMYPREMIAEKFHAMASLGDRNSRVKDLRDVVCLARRFAFDGETLRTTIAETFHRRGTSFAIERPVALHPAYYDDTGRTQHWQVLQQQIPTDAHRPERLVDAGQELRHFLGPVCDSLIEDSPFTQAWPAVGPWRPSVQSSDGRRRRWLR